MLCLNPPWQKNGNVLSTPNEWTYPIRSHLIVSNYTHAHNFLTVITSRRLAVMPRSESCAASTHADTEIARDFFFLPWTRFVFGHGSVLRLRRLIICRLASRNFDRGIDGLLRVNSFSLIYAWLYKTDAFGNSARSSRYRTIDEIQRVADIACQSLILDPLVIFFIDWGGQFSARANSMTFAWVMSERRPQGLISSDFGGYITGKSPP